MSKKRIRESGWDTTDESITDVDAPFRFNQKQSSLDHIVIAPSIVSEQELELICTKCKTLTGQVDAVVGEGINHEIRKSTVCHLPSSDFAWLYERVASMIINANFAYWNFNLSGWVEPVQYTRYDKDGFYTWHMDCGSASASTRKVSMTIQLSDPESYEGGEFQIWISGKEPVTLEKKRGCAIIFPSFCLHRVTPVTRGCRESLVVWIHGPAFT